VLSDAVTVDSNPEVTYACAGMIRVADGSLVVRGCGAEGDVPVPPATAPFT
jgi:hypothetical protein